jgi:uncharacterized protein (UPF0305 family)
MKKFLKRLFRPLAKRANFNMVYSDLVIREFTTTVDDLRQANEDIARDMLEAHDVIKEHVELVTKMKDTTDRNKILINNIETFLTRAI